VEGPPSPRPWSHQDPAARRLVGLVGIGTALGLAHHVEHIVRDQVGWPLSSEVNPFTISLVVYPVVALGFELSRRGKVGPGFWGLVALAGAVAIAVVHFSGLTDETPDSVRAAYASSAAGWVALAIAAALVAVLVAAAVYAAVLWIRRRAVPAAPA
jgi:hypothetical protein